jgi:hypothetical protein
VRYWSRQLQRHVVRACALSIACNASRSGLLPNSAALLRSSHRSVSIIETGHWPIGIATRKSAGSGSGWQHTGRAVSGHKFAAEALCLFWYRWIISCATVRIVPTRSAAVNTVVEMFVAPAASSSAIRSQILSGRPVRWRNSTILSVTRLLCGESSGHTPACRQLLTHRDLGSDGQVGGRGP